MTNVEKVNERELALEILLLVEKNGMHSHLAMNQVLEKYQYLEKKSRAFITRLAHGSLERMLEMDEVINQFSSTPVCEMKPVIRCILRSGVYQLLYMDGVPASAACNEAVELAEKKGFSGLKGFVNGIMRAVSRAKEEGTIQYPDEQTDPIHYLSVTTSTPQWLIEYLMEDYDYDTTKSILNACLQEAPTSIRVNTEHISVEDLQKELEASGIKAQRTEFCEDALLISDYDYIAKIPAFERGDFYVQDLSSMQVALMADVQKGWKVMDVCAAPGGKAIHVAQLMQGTGYVDARDINRRKVKLMQENVDRYQLKNMSVLEWDVLTRQLELEDTIDLVIADVPCSGLGVLRSKPDKKYRLTMEQINDLVALQRDILEVVNCYVKPGGKLIYSTCTINEDENVNNRIWFEASYPEFYLMKEVQILPDELHDGFYIAVFERQVD